MYTSRTQIHMVKIMLEILVPTLWTCLAVYVGWYFTLAKHSVPITRKEAKALWHIHKQNIQCGGKKRTEIKRRDKIIGFQCECGYKHVQKRPIRSNTPAYNLELRNSEYSAVDSLHGPYKSK